MYQQRRQLAHRFSVTELMQMGQQSYSHLFPLIESSQYQDNATFSLNSIQHKKTCDEDIDKYFMLYGNGHRQCPTSPRLGRHRLSTVSTETSFSGYMAPRNSIMSRQSYVSPIYVGKNSIFGELYTIDESSSKEGTVPPFISYGCVLEYEQISDTLQVRMIHNIGPKSTFISNLLGKQKNQLFAKVQLLPGRSKTKMTAVMSSNDSKPSQYDSLVRFWCNGMERNTLNIRIFSRRGLFKRHKLIDEWVVGIDTEKLHLKQTIWKSQEMPK